AITTHDKTPLLGPHYFVLTPLPLVLIFSIPILTFSTDSRPTGHVSTEHAVLSIPRTDVLMSGFSVPGGVICDGKGKWILGYNRSLGKCLVAVVELWGILDGLLLLQKQGYAKVIIQSDNLENVISIYESKFYGQKAL
ncbi:hypothetical protein Goklo_001146, partial [Gossypium klotzschianum]|nr:hypothetical protein [Gossypium klotzschianum]